MNSFTPAQRRQVFTQRMRSFSRLIRQAAAVTESPCFFNFPPATVSSTYATPPVHGHDLPAAPARDGGR
ncbi:MAG: hypothetical protein Q8Q74_16370, partial [Polaromonas sp.]|nr:hypothetical protein [Polaromonas sp.]